MSHATEERINEVPTYKVDEANTFAEKRVTRISIVSQNPDALLGVDTNRVASYQAPWQSITSCDGSHAIKQITMDSSSCI